MVGTAGIARAAGAGLPAGAAQSQGAVEAHRPGAGALSGGPEYRCGAVRVGQHHRVPGPDLRARLNGSHAPDETPEIKTAPVTGPFLFYLPDYKLVSVRARARHARSPLQHAWRPPVQAILGIGFLELDQEAHRPR